MNIDNEMILIVDDDEPVRQLISCILAREGYQCTLATSAEDALEQLERQSFSLLISDINMPGITGIDLLRQVHEMYNDMAVIMVTAVNDRHVAVQSLYMGAFGYISKPFDKNELIINVTNALRRRKLEIENRLHSIELEMLVSARTN